jgi:hypothetical protein
MDHSGGFMSLTTVNRVAKHTSQEINDRIALRTKSNIDVYGSSSEAIAFRLERLDREWDIERSLEANGSTLLLIGLGMAAFVDRRWMLLPMFVGAFCLQHALQGWCPPIELFRRMGVRTAREIEEERVALKAVRGDFNAIPRSDVNQALEAARK